MQTLASSSSYFSFSAGFLHRPTTRLCRRTVVSASKRDDYGCGGETVDEDMIVLRKRIHETKMAERNYEPPEEWMEWEKQYYTSYDSDVCEAVGMLQALLMNTRPGVTVGMLALLLLSVPTSAIFVCFQMVRALGYLMPGLLHLLRP